VGLCTASFALGGDRGDPDVILGRQELDEAGASQSSDEGGGRLASDPEAPCHGRDVRGPVGREPIEALELCSGQAAAAEVGVDPFVDRPCESTTRAHDVRTRCPPRPVR
jgi:hypothetical protein